MTTFAKIAFIFPFTNSGQSVPFIQTTPSATNRVVSGYPKTNAMNDQNFLRMPPHQRYAAKWLELSRRSDSGEWARNGRVEKNGSNDAKLPTEPQPLDESGDKKFYLEVGYDAKSGTSMATPHVAAVVADILAINPKLDVNAVREILKQSAVSGKLDHLHALIRAEDSLTDPVTLPDLGSPVVRAQSFAGSIEAIRPITHKFANSDQAKAAFEACQQCHALVAGIEGNTVSVVPRQVMIQVSKDMANDDFETLSAQLSQRLSRCGDELVQAKISVTGKIAPRTFVATVSCGELSRSLKEEDYDHVSAQSIALQDVCQSLPGSEGIELVEADIIYPVYFDQTMDVNPRVNDAMMHPLGAGPRDPLRPRQWALNDGLSHGIGTDAAKAYRRIKGFKTPREAGIHVGVGDTGRGIHPDMEGIYLPGRRFVGSDYAQTDCLDRAPTFSHGAHVAGTIAAITGNRVGTEGVTDALILPAKILSDKGTASLIDIILGVRWMAGLDIDGNTYTKTPARVINLSIGFEDNCSKFFQDTIDEAAKKGVVIVVAAGNENTDATRSCPANCKNVITVGAIDQTGQRVRFSNFGLDIDIYAPGVDILAPTHKVVEKTEPSVPGLPPSLQQPEDK